MRELQARRQCGCGTAVARSPASEPATAERRWAACSRNPKPARSSAVEPGSRGAGEPGSRGCAFHTATVATWGEFPACRCSTLESDSCQANGGKIFPRSFPAKNLDAAPHPTTPISRARGSRDAREWRAWLSRIHRAAMATAAGGLAPIRAVLCRGSTLHISDQTPADAMLRRPRRREAGRRLPGRVWACTFAPTGTSPARGGLRKAFAPATAPVGRLKTSSIRDG